jgi:hypothetical protein
MSKIYHYLKKSLSHLQETYENNGVATWHDFSVNPNLKKLVVEVDENDFANGTLRITRPCLIRFKENVKFNPNRPKTWLDKDGIVTTDFEKAVALDPARHLDWFPTSDVPSNVALYLTGDVVDAYRLGFFAALTIEAEGVIIDLNGYALSQHEEHALVQRFFSLIELADQPFVPKKGPVHFGADFKSAKKVWIKKVWNKKSPRSK